MFVLQSDITIGNFRFSGVNDVRVKKSIHGLVETALIKLPSIAKVTKNGKVSADTVITGKQFKDGDAVIIKLGYNGSLQEEFRGFVKRRDLNMPLEVECEGYSWLLRRNSVHGFWPAISIKDLLLQAVSGLNTKIEVQCDFDLQLYNIRANNIPGIDLIENIQKYTDNCLTCFFIKPDTLWCGLAGTAYAQGAGAFNLGMVKYRLGYNVVKDNNLKERSSDSDPVSVVYSKRLSNGTVLSGTSDVFKQYVTVHERVLNHLRNADALKQLANEKAVQLNYTGYEGNVASFLEPYAAPGYLAYVTDSRYPERDGNYLVESTEVRFGVNGARRIIELGAKVGFAKTGNQ